MSASPLSIIPNHSGANYADLKPLLRLGEGDKRPSSSLTDAIKERFKHFKELEDTTFQEMISAGEEVALFMQGKQFLRPNPYSPGGWLPYKVDPKKANAAERRALSIMQYHTSGNLEKWENSNPDIRVKPGVQSDDAHEAADGASIIVNHYEDKFYGPRLTQAECLEGLTFGSYLWRLGLDSNLKTVTAYRQIFENRKIELDPSLSWGKCGDCGKEGTALDFNEIPGEGIHTCPSCHGEAIVIPAASDEMPSFSKSEAVQLPDFCLNLFSLPQCRWDLKFHADESPWLIISRRTSMSAIRQLLGNISLPDSSGSDRGLDTIDRLAYSGQATAGHSNLSASKSLYKDPASINEFWMSPDIYGDIRLTFETETVGGQRIPRDTPLGNLFGGQKLCALLLNEGAALLGLFPEDHQDYVVQGKWYAKTGTGAGRGLQDLTEVQKVLNSDHQQTHTYLRSIATPAMLTLDVLQEDDARYIGTPGKNIVVPMAMLAEGVTPDMLVRPAFQASGVPAQFFEFTYNRLREYAEFSSHVLPFSSGMPGVKNDTATGAQITQAATNALYTPVLSVKGEVRKLIAEKLIKLYPKFMPVNRPFALGGKYGRHTIKWLNGADLKTDLIFEVVPDSWNTRNSYTKRQDYAAFMQMFGGNYMFYLQAKSQDPDGVQELERTYDLERESEAQNVAGSLCFRRVRQMQQMANAVQDPMMLVGVQPDVQIDPGTGQPTSTGQLVVTGQGVIQPPVSQAEPSHEIKRDWLMEYLDSDDGLEAPMNLRHAVELLIMLHHQFAGSHMNLLAHQQGEAQVAGAQPGMEAQQAQAGQAQQQMGQQQQQMQLEQQGQQADLQAEAAKVGLDAAKKNIEHAHVSRMNAVKASDREHQLATAAAQKVIQG
jgi:hypothetical protein